MTGSVRRKSQGWEISVSAGFDPATGRRRRASRYIKGTKREAEKALASLVVEVGQGRHVATNATLEDAIVTWLSIAERDLSPTTLARYRQIVRLHVLPELGSVPLRRLDASHLDRLYVRLSAGGLAPATVRQVHAVIRRALNQAFRWDWISLNPALRATPPRLVRHEIDPPGPDAVRLLHETARAEGSHDLADLVWLAAVTGARRSELCGLRWDDLDGDVLRIARAVVSVKELGTIVKDTKTHAVRRIALDASTVEVVRQRRVRAAELALFVGVPLGPWVFSNEPGHAEPLFPNLVTQRFKQLCKRAGLDGIRWHDLRHYAATRMLDAGIPVTTAAKRLGHRDGTVTVGIYGHRVVETDREAARVLGNLMIGGRAPSADA